MYSRVDGQVTGKPGVGVVHGQDHESSQEHTNGSIDNVEVRHNKRIRVLPSQRYFFFS